MQINLRNKKVFASTGGRPFDKDKPCIIFLHGSGFDHTIWMLQTRYFAFHGYSVLALDLPGHGLSQGESLKSIEAMSDWLKEVIDILGCKDISLVGHSQGCLVSIEFASQNPDRIKTITLMGGSDKIPVNQLLLDLAKKNDPKVVKIMMDWSHSHAAHYGSHPIPGMNHINIGKSIILKNSIQDTLATDLNACNNYKNGVDAAKKIMLPVLFIVGNQDKMCPINQSKETAKYIKKSQIKIINNCGHMMLLEKADETLSILKKFINENY